jgi:hypothetical protein
VLHLFVAAAICIGGVEEARPGAATPVVASDSLRAAFEGGQRWGAFYSGVNRRRETWDRAWAISVPDSLIARARAAGSWRVLAITEPGCSDSANSVPILARLAEGAANLDLRLIDSKVGKAWMEAHRTRDGRAATPTFLVLDDQFRIRGCWVERPMALQEFLKSKDSGGEFDSKMEWYVKDEGREIMRELVEMLEAAKTDIPICRRAS